LLQEIERNVPTTDIKKWNVMDAMRGIAVAWESITSTVIQNCFSKCSFGIEDAVVTEDDQDNSDWVELQGHVDCPSNFDEFLNVDQLIPTTEDHTATSLDVPDSEQVAYEREGEGEGIQLLPARPTRKDAVTALLVLDTVISASDADEKIVKEMDDIQEFVSKTYTQSLKQRSIDSYLRNYYLMLSFD
jgi:hypothetical protein